MSTRIVAGDEAAGTLVAFRADSSSADWHPVASGRSGVCRLMARTVLAWPRIDAGLWSVSGGWTTAGGRTDRSLAEGDYLRELVCYTISGEMSSGSVEPAASASPISRSTGSPLAMQLRSLPQVWVEDSSNVEDVVDALGLAGPMLETVSALGRFFPEAGFVIDLERGEDRAGVIRIDVHVGQLDPDEADDVLQRFDDDWWLDRPLSVRSRVSVYLA